MSESRRKFIRNVAIAGTGLTIVPRYVIGRGFAAPSDRLNIAAVGVGGQGRTNLVNLATQNIVAMCDVDWGFANKGFDRLSADVERARERLSCVLPENVMGARFKDSFILLDRERL